MGRDGGQKEERGRGRGGLLQIEEFDDLIEIIRHHDRLQLRNTVSHISALDAIPINEKVCHYPCQILQGFISIFELSPANDGEDAC